MQFFIKRFLRCEFSLLIVFTHMWLFKFLVTKVSVASPPISSVIIFLDFQSLKMLLLVFWLQNSNISNNCSIDVSR